MNQTREEKIAAARVRLAELAAKFIDRSRDDMRVMRDASRKVRGGDAGGLTEIRHLAHRMAGTGATLGYETLGERATSIEALIDSLPGGALPDAATLSRLAEGLDALEAQLAADANKLAGP